MADKVLINLATGLEDSERVTVAFLVAGAARWTRPRRRDVPDQGSRASSPARSCGRHRCDGCPPLSRLFKQFADGGGELLVCPICVTARKLDADAFVPNALVAGATPMWEWLGDEAGTIFSY